MNPTNAMNPKMETVQSSLELQKEIRKQVLDERHFYVNLATFGLVLIGWLVFQQYLFPKYIDDLPTFFLEIIDRLEAWFPIGIGIWACYLVIQGIKTLVFGTKWQEKKIRERLETHILTNADLHETIKDNLKNAILEGKIEVIETKSNTQKAQSMQNGQSQHHQNGASKPLIIEPIPPTKRITF